MLDPDNDMMRVQFVRACAILKDPDATLAAMRSAMSSLGGLSTRIVDSQAASFEFIADDPRFIALMKEWQVKRAGAG